jgi:hypothetical protein
MPFLTASALNDNAEGLDVLRAVLSDNRSQRHSPRAPSWTPSTAYLGGEVAYGTGSAKPRISRLPLIIHGVIIPLRAAYTPVAKQCPF